MMKNSLKPLLSLSLAASLAFGLAACSHKSEPTPSPTSTPSSTAPTSTASPTAQATEQATTRPTVDPTAAPKYSGTAETELEEAKQAFPDVEAVDGATKEDVQLAMLGAYRYVNTIYNSGYLMNGSWVKNGADSQELVKLYGKDWSDDYRLKLEVLIDTYHNGETEEAKTKAAKDLMNHFFYFTPYEGAEIPKDCSENTVGVSSCLVNGKLEFTAEPAYQVKKDSGSIYVDVYFDAKMRILKDGVQGVTPIRYHVQLEMKKNPYPDAANLRFAYIVNDLGGDWNIDEWREGVK
jgi:hypothetical protein